MQKLKSHLVRTQGLSVLPLKPGVGQYTAKHKNTLSETDLAIQLILSDDIFIYCKQHKWRVVTRTDSESYIRTVFLETA